MACQPNPPPLKVLQARGGGFLVVWFGLVWFGLVWFGFFICSDETIA